MNGTMFDTQLSGTLPHMGPGRSQCTIDIVGHRPASQIASCDHQGVTREIIDR